MHPILAGRGRFVLYLLAWVLLSGILAAALGQGEVDWSQAFVVALPLGLAWGFVCLTSFYLCRAAPLRVGRWPRIVGTHAGAAAISASLWLTAGRGWIVLLGPGRLNPAIDAAYLRAVPILWALGMLSFLLSSAVHYGLEAHEATREAEKVALEFQVLSRDAQLTTLRAQIHPHFLFNALNSISALTTRDPAAARRVCVMLGDFLRRSLALGNAETVPLSEELALAEALLSVERVRFGERLGVDFAVDEAARPRAVPALILQPLVENAITHGVARRLEGGRVRIAARLREGALELQVDNPRDPEAASRPGTGVGLDNVRRRLAALYGDEAELRVDAAPETFTVRLRLPPR
jgi:hypothetical protein